MKICGHFDVVATNWTFYILAVFDALKVILCITLVLSFSNTPFDVGVCIYLLSMKP